MTDNSPQPAGCDSSGGQASQNGTPARQGGRLRCRVEQLRRGFAAFTEGLGEYYYGPYRQALARAQRDEDDLFMLYVCGEALGIPNPASAYTMELYPIVLEEFHAWHTRMGMDRPPTDGIRCC